MKAVQQPLVKSAMQAFHEAVAIELRSIPPVQCGTSTLNSELTLNSGKVCTEARHTEGYFEKEREISSAGILKIRAI